MFERVNTPIMGIVENMSGMACPHCNEIVDVFGGGGGQKRWHQIQPDFVPGGEHPTVADGVAEVMPEGFAFLRRMGGNLLAQHDDIYVPAALVKKYQIATGSHVVGKVEEAQNGRRPTCNEIESVDGQDPDEYKLRVPFKHLTTIDPDRWAFITGTACRDARNIDVTSTSSVGCA